MRDNALHSDVLPCDPHGLANHETPSHGDPPHETGFEALRRKRTYPKERPRENGRSLQGTCVTYIEPSVVVNHSRLICAEQKELLDANAKKVRNYGEQPREANVL